MRTKDRHLKLRGMTFYFVRDVPKDVREQYGRAKIEVSLKTRDRQFARELRDAKATELERTWHAIREGRKISAGPDTEFMQQASEERLEFTHGDLRVTPMLDDIIDQIDALAVRHTDGDSQEALDAARDYVLEHTEEGKRLQHQLDLYHGRLSYSDAGAAFLAQSPDLKEKTRSEYRRAFSLADKSLPPMERLTKQSLQRFANQQGKTKAAATVNKELSAIRGVMEFQGLDVEPLKRVKAHSVVPEVRRLVWTSDDLRAVLEASKSKWLASTVAIALYTGARQGAIARMSYDEEMDWLVFPRQKKESDDRKIPCPERLRDTVRAWVAAPKSQSAINTQFTQAKYAAGFDLPEHKNTLVFHSLRHMTASRYSDLGVPEHLAARIIGHKSQTMTYGRYGSKGEVEALREYINMLDWSDIVRL